MKKLILAFDLYGTLLSTDSISDALAKHCEKAVADAIATTWRRYQLEYTWRLNSMRQYEDFEVVTKKSLRHALLEHGVEVDAQAVDSVMQAYDSLSAFPDVEAVLPKLKGMTDIECVIFSNGTARMIESSVKGSKGLVKDGDIFSKVVSVDHVMSFKPSPAVYRYLSHCLESPDGEDIWLISSNPFDVVGARAVGIKAVWVDRTRKGWRDRLGPEPSVVIHSLEELCDVISAR